MQINYSKKNDIGLIELNNPPYNLLTSPIFMDPAELTQFIGDKSLKGIIIHGAGHNFCAGADRDILADQIKNPDKFSDLLKNGKKIIDIIHRSTVPVIAAVQGSCLGAGMEIALACHFIFASKNAMFGFPESGLHLIPGLGGTILIGNRLSRKDAINMILSAEMINGETALQIGLIDRIFPGKQVLEQSRNYLKSLTGNKPANLIRIIMQSIHNSESMTRSEALKIETENFIRLARQLDAPEKAK